MRWFRLSLIPVGLFWMGVVTLLVARRGLGPIGPILAVFLVACVLTLGLAAVNLTLAALARRRVEPARESLARAPLRCFLLGCLTLVTEVWLVTLAGPPLRGLLVLVVLTVDLIWLAGGLPALTGLLGESLGAPAGPRALLAGTFLFGCMGGLPVLGWLLQTALLCMALGARWEPPIGRLRPAPPLRPALAGA